MRRFVAVDLETTGLDPAQDYIAEVGIAGEKYDGSYFETAFSLEFPEGAMSAGAAAVNGWGNRAFAPMVSWDWAGGQLLEVLRGAYIVGKNPHFDDNFLRMFFREVGITPSWHYRLVDVGALAWGWAARTPVGSVAEDWFKWFQPPNVEDVGEMVGIPRRTVKGFDGRGYHTAALDARWAYQVFRNIVPKEV